ncbi:type II toxin-antitoxin system death-on-curing family toxin [Photobacterium phosphoreum]|jgi:death-on-curing protein|uniref:Type II toxin-antitoxin system death-on-curing family toxin n=1 Tax=Photobacterium phosphoreum TaxID=659 RepID=A0AAW4ZX60_PHOPO|nr:type II toxin-antitoxin system death-on-curing family toxin [Photobacterium phosphoreum]MCD9475362.1 type II toxin-antitoxin system death-on-curing family toxin [Photobacterium phosphoreum]MCD9490865.1 type II toxin-antitoxin system death-on-curing family toxin [Photobacterium phosphoreum]MCD9510712.1 type II toxin-antitoxin system death-on-curing family toxin [Photobacterium phosphoreum]MCF2176174.1 type II toxin-antitoxin system death-on-curing family toxin [Photobacterium phosphoreum]MCF
MNIICFPFERVIEINTFILENEPGMKGAADISKLQGALGRIDNAIVYDGLDDVFEIAAKYTASIAVSHSLPDANKRTGLVVALEYLSLNDYELTSDNDLLANAVRDLVIGEINENDFADILYAQYAQENSLSI